MTSDDSNDMETFELDGYGEGEAQGDSSLLSSILSMIEPSPKTQAGKPGNTFAKKKDKRRLHPVLAGDLLQRN